MSSSSIRNRFVAAGMAGVVLLGLNSPAAASDQNSPAVLTSHLPWLAPTGHRQPTKADVRREGIFSMWEQRQQALDAALDRKLLICRGC